MGNAKHSGTGNRLIATVIGSRGKCAAGHVIGDRFELSVHNPGGLCGIFYHRFFPTISVMQFGGKFPWWDEGQTVFTAECLERENRITIRVEIEKR